MNQTTTETNNASQIPASDSHLLHRLVTAFNESSGCNYTLDDFLFDHYNGDLAVIYFYKGWIACQNQVIKELEGHKDSELWEEQGLLKATMKCVHYCNMEI